jgi:hypothetical protein
MRTLKATDLRPGIRQATVRTITNVTFPQDGTVHVRWNDGTDQVLQPEAELAVEDA